MGLGGAHMMTSDEPTAVFEHPALLRGASGLALDLQRWGEHAEATSVSAATSWWGGKVSVGLGLRSFQHTAVAVDGFEGPHPQDRLFVRAGIASSDRVAALGAAMTFFDLDWGVSLRLAEHQFGSPGVVRRKDAEVGFGVAREVGPVTVGLSAHDLLDDPADLELGVGSYGWEVGFLDVGVTARLGLVDEDLVGGGGLELGYWPVRGRTFVARVGAQSVPDGSDANPMTMGFAYWGDALILEWAFQPFTDAAEGGTHRFSIGWR
jgi:hypothetical protein